MTGPLPRGGTLAVAALLFNALTWGLSWWPFRQLQQAGLHALWSTALIYGVAVAVVTVLRPRAWLQLARTPALWVTLLAAGCTNLGFNWGVTIGEVARVVLLFYLTPLWTVLLARWLLGERADAAVWLRVAMALAGALLVLSSGAAAGGPAGDRPIAPPGLADALAVMGGFAFALNNVMLRRTAALPAEGRSLAMFGGGLLLSLTVACAASALGSGSVSGGVAGVAWPPPFAWSWLLPTLGLALAFLLSNLALQYGASRLPANVTAVVMPAEIVFAALSAAVWAGERPGPALWLGGALILGATLLAAWRHR
jgi:drug/metabolite transporter (DMT)-like permease